MAYPLGAGELSTLRAQSHWSCNLFKVTRRGGGPPLRFSDSDRQQVYRGEVYVPTAGERYDEQSEATLAAGGAQLVGALSPKTITAVDVQRGVYDNARIDQYDYDWRRGKRYNHFLWFVEEIAHDGRIWTAKLTSSARFMQATVGDIYHSSCPAILGDERCTKVVTTADMTVTTVVDSQIEFNQANTSFAANWWASGFVQWTTGNNRGSLSRVLQSTAAGNFKLSTPTRFTIRAGDEFTASPGCDGLATTCKNKFNNLENFRGNERQKNAKQLILSRGTA